MKKLSLSQDGGDFFILSTIPAPSLDKALYRQDKLVLLVPPTHPLAGRDRIAFADALEYDHVGLNQGSSLLERLIDAAVAAEKPLRLRLQQCDRTLVTWRRIAAKGRA